MYFVLKLNFVIIINIMVSGLDYIFSPYQQKCKNEM